MPIAALKISEHNHENIEIPQLYGMATGYIERPIQYERSGSFFD